MHILYHVPSSLGCMHHGIHGIHVFCFWWKRRTQTMWRRNYRVQDRRCFLSLLSERGWGTGEEITAIFYLHMLISGMIPTVISICEQRHNTPLPFSALPLGETAHPSYFYPPEQVCESNTCLPGENKRQMTFFRHEWYIFYCLQQPSNLF